MKLKITFPKNNTCLDTVFNTMDESKFNYELLNDIIECSFGKQLEYDLVFDTEYKANGVIKHQYGQYIVFEDDTSVRYIAISAKSAVDTRNGYVAAKMPVILRKWFYDSTEKEKMFELYLLDTDSLYCVNDYNTFIYRLTKSFDIKILNEKRLPYIKYDNRNHDYRRKKILLDSPITRVKEIKRTRDLLQGRNTGNRSSYILEAGEFYIIYGKVDANSEFEVVYLTSIIQKIAQEEGKKVFLYQVQELYSQSIGEENKKLLTDMGVTVYEDLQEYENNPDLVIDESKTSRNQAEFYRNLLKKYNNGSDYKCCYFCGVDFQDMLIASHILRVTDIDNLEMPFAEKRKKAIDGDNGFWLCPAHDKYLENGYVYFENNKLKLSPKLNEKQKEKIKQTFYTGEIEDHLIFCEEEFYIIEKDFSDEKFDIKINRNHYNENMHQYLEEHRKRVCASSFELEGVDEEEA
jgi:hypothetical protein